jgi:hypothetical protein
MRASRIARIRRSTAWSVLAGLALGMAGASGCGGGQDGEAPAPVNQDAMKKSMEATRNYYQQKHATKKK